MEPIVSTETTEINLTHDYPYVRQHKTIIHSMKPMVYFKCQHCGATFSTTDWMLTKGRHHSASCPCCPYRAWAS